MKIETILSGAFVVGVATLSLGFLFSQEPEYVTAGSEDGFLTLKGVARESQPFTINKKESNLPLPLLGSSYDIGPSGVTLDVPVEISFHTPLLQEEGLGEVSYAVYRFDSKRQMWSMFGGSAVEVDELGTFSLGKKWDVVAPEFLTVYEELLTLAPKNTVGYETTVGYKADGGALIRLPGSGEHGGCGGAMGTGDGEEISEKERTASVLLNDVMTSVTFIFRTRWLTASSGTACAEESPLKAGPDYVILPQ